METQILTPSWRETQNREDAASPSVVTGGVFLGGEGGGWGVVRF